MVMHRQVRLDEAIQACSKSARDFESFVEPLVFAEVRGARHLASKKPVSVGVAYWQEPDSGRVHTVMVVAPGGVKRVVEAVDTALTDYLTKLFSQSTASAAQTTFRYGAWQLLSEDVKFVLDTHPSKLVEEDDEEEGGEGEEAPEPDAEEAGQESDLGAEDKEEGPAGWDEQTIRDAAEEAGIDISEFDMGQLVAGMRVELEHGTQDGDTDVTADDPVETLKIVIAHMRELPNYYTLLDDMEEEGKAGAEKLVSSEAKTESRRPRTISEHRKQVHKESLRVQARSRRRLAKEQFLNHPGDSTYGARLHGGPWIVTVSAKSASEAKELIRTELMTNKTLRDFWRQWEELGAPVEKVGKADPREVVNRKESFRRHWTRKR